MDFFKPKDKKIYLYDLNDDINLDFIENFQKSILSLLKNRFKKTFKRTLN